MKSNHNYIGPTFKTKNDAFLQNYLQNRGGGGPGGNPIHGDPGWGGGLNAHILTKQFL